MESRVGEGFTEMFTAMVSFPTYCVICFVFCLFVFLLPFDLEIYQDFLGTVPMLKFARTILVSSLNISSPMV